MKVNPCLVFQIFSLVGLSVVGPDLAAVQVLFVSPDGDDTWSGGFATPLPDKKDGPLASLEAAQARVRDWIADTGKAREPIMVTLREGTYPIGATLDFTEADSGIGPAPVTWQAHPEETVILHGGTAVGEFRLLSDTAIPARVPGRFRDRIHVVNLKEAGIAFPERLERRERYDVASPGPFQLYYEGELMTLARYPNEGWLRVAGVPQEGPRRFHEGHHEDRRDGRIPTGRHYGSIEYEGDRPASWASPDEAWAHGYWTWDWADSTQRIERLDAAGRRITFAEPHSIYGYTTGQRFYFFNIPEELDSPGEWYLDGESGYLFFWPPGGAFSGEVVLTRLGEPMIRMENVRHLTLKGLQFAYGRGAAIRIRDSEAVSVEDGRFFCLGGRPVTIEGGRACRVANGEFTEISADAIYVDGGDRATLEPGNHQVVNNHIHDFAKVFRTNHPAIWIDGVGQRVAHNRIHNAPHMGLYFRGNDHLIEYNEIHDIARETGDVGAIYTGRDYTSRGTVVRFNYLHDLHGPGLHGVRGVYLDDFTSGIQVFGNVFHRAGRAAFIGGGRDNLIQNNLFVECEPSVQIDGRALSWAVHHFDESHPRYASTLRDKFREANATQPPYALRYPELVQLYEDEPRVPKYNVVENNLSFAGIFLDLFDGVDLELAIVRNNLIADPVCLRMTASSDQAPDFTIIRQGDPGAAEQLQGNLLWSAPPGLYDFTSRPIRFDFTRLPDIGFLPIPLDRIGLLR